MSADIVALEAPERVYRVARRPDAFALPSWEHASNDDGTFGGRYDDPRGEYRVLYVSRSRVGAFCETLAPMRPSLDVLTGIEAVVREGAPVDPSRFALPAEWAANRVVGEAASAGAFADVGHSTTIERLRGELGTVAPEMGLDEFDAATIRLSSPRRLTQLVSRLVYEETDEDGSPRFAGVAYRSRLGDDLSNVAIFERPESTLPLTDSTSAEISPDDTDLTAALALLGLELG